MEDLEAVAMELAQEMIERLTQASMAHPLPTFLDMLMTARAEVDERIQGVRSEIREREE